MIAIEWLRAGCPAFTGQSIAAALAVHGQSTSSTHHSDDALFALVGGGLAQAGHYRVAVTGHLDNAADVAAQLGTAAPQAGDAAALAGLYGLALSRWGAEADLRLVGEYAAIALDSAARTLRLSRSPLRAPPLHYHASRERVIAASAVRAIFACGIERRLNDAKLADHALFNFTGEGEGWYMGLHRVPLGSVVEFTPDREQVRGYYDFGAIPEVRCASTADYLAEARHVLTEATRAALAGSTRPAAMLSGGLDSALVATSALDLLGGEQELPTFSFVPCPGWHGAELPGRYGDERPLVEELAAMHPRLRPQFFDNPGQRLDDDFNAMFAATGAAPINLVNLTMYHPMWRVARDMGCDRILLGEFGNVTLSNSGDWAFAEWFARLRWGRLTGALHSSFDDERPLWRRFIGSAVLPWVPDPVWRWQRRVRGCIDIFEAASPLRRDYAVASGAVERAAAAGVPVARHPVHDRLADFRSIHHEAWGEFSDIYDGFEQLYGIEQRDPMAWRPLLEFCAGIPSDLFVRDGERRWLARELGRGVLPDSIRRNRRKGLHQADWHLRLGRQRERLLALLTAMERVPRLADMIDFARIRPAVENWPASDAVSDHDRLVLESALPRAILLGRFVAWAEGAVLE